MSYLSDVEKMADVFAEVLLRRDGLELWKNEGTALADESYRLARGYVGARKAFAAAHRNELNAADDLMDAKTGKAR